VDGFHHAPDALLRWPEAEVGFSGSRRIHPPLHPLESAALSRRTPQAVIKGFRSENSNIDE
jgi:hypothetical protein